MHKLLPFLLLAALSLTACIKRSAIDTIETIEAIEAMDASLVEMETQARIEWITLDRDSVRPEATGQVTLYSGHGLNLYVDLNYTRREARTEWKGKRLVLKGEEAGFETVYRDGKFALHMGLDTATFYKGDKLLLVDGREPKAENYSNDKGQGMQVRRSRFDDHVLVIFQGDSLFLRQQHGLIHSERFFDAHYTFGHLVAKYELWKDGVRVFEGTLRSPESGISGYEVRQGAKKLFRKIFPKR